MTHKPTTRAEMVEALRALSDSTESDQLSGIRARTIGRITKLIALASRLPGPPEAAECRVANKVTVAMMEAGETAMMRESLSGGPMYRADVVASVYAAMERARTSAPAADPPQGEPSDTERLDCVLKWASEIVAKIPGGIRCIDSRADIDAVISAHRREREREGES